MSSIEGERGGATRVPASPLEDELVERARQELRPPPRIGRDDVLERDGGELPKAGMVPSGEARSETAPREDGRKPILWAFSLSRLQGLLEQIMPQYAAVAEIHVFHMGFEAALEVARELMLSGEEVDVFLSAGRIGAYLREHASVPVVVIAPSGFDILQALSRARQISSRIGIVTFGVVPPELKHFEEIFGLGIEQRSYTTIAEAESSVQSLAERGVEVIVGPSAVTEISERVGLKGIFLYSENSVRDAIGRAIEIAHIARAEVAKREHVDAILRHIHEGVIAVDLKQRIESMNPAMERLLGFSRERALGMALPAVARELDASRVLETGVAKLEGIQRVGQRTLVTNRIPLRDGDIVTGALLTCQDASSIERVDRSLRSRHRSRRHVPRYRLADVAGTSPAIRQARALAERYARSDATVLIVGATGTGKEVFAQGIHGASARRDRPFVAVNCAALPETLLESELFGYDEGAFTGSRRGGKRGLFEAAHRGTLFLDEVGDVPLALQTRLLRVLQEREVLRLGSSEPTPVDVRVIAATNRELKESVDEGSFREDLYYRLDILKLHLPPLDARREDIPLLAAQLLEAALRRYGALAHRDRVLQMLLPHLERHTWRGNIRELENVLERVAVICAHPADGGALEAHELRVVVPELFEEWPAPGGRSARSEGERAHVLRVLAECNGNQTEAARRLGIGRTTLWRKLSGRTRT